MTEAEIDGELIEAIKAGERRGLAELYDKYAPVMLRVAFRILRNRRDAEDLLHDVFLEVWRKAQAYDSRRGSVRNWLLIRVRSRAIDRMRTLRLAQAHAMAERANEQTMGAECDEVAKAADAGVARNALNSLNSAQRQVIELGYFQGLTCREIAQRCEIPVGTVKSRLSGALVKLRRQLNTAAEIV